MQPTTLPLESLVNRFIKIDIRIFAVLVSIAMSFFSLYINPIYNPDATFYFYVAEIYQNEGFEAANTFYRRPFYPILFHHLSEILDCSYASAAYIINAASTALLIFSFISIVQQFSDDRLTSIFAAILILLMPTLNEYRYFIIRDFGFWAFLLTSILYFIKFIREEKRVYAWIVWPVASGIAVIFRPEAFLLFLLPITLLFTQREKRKKQLTNCLHLYALPTLLLAPVLFTQFGAQAVFTEYVWQSILSEIAFYEKHLNTAVQPAIDTIKYQILGVPADNFAESVFVISFLYILIYRIIETLSLPLLFVLIAGKKKDFIRIPSDFKTGYLALCTLFFLMLLVFVFTHYYISGRFTLTLILLLLILIPGITTKLYQRAFDKGKTKRFHIILGLVCVFFFTDGFISFGTKKEHVTQGISWMQENIDPSATLLTNHVQAGYLSRAQVDLPEMKDFIDYNKLDKESIKKMIAKYDYIAIVGKKKEFDGTKLIFDELMESQTVFRNKKNAFFIIYKNDATEHIAMPNGH